MMPHASSLSELGMVPHVTARSMKQNIYDDPTFFAGYTYREEGRRDTTWFVDRVVKYHRTVETYINTLIDAGLSIRRCLEPAATPEAEKARPELVEQRRRPPFLLIRAARIGA